MLRIIDGRAMQPPEPFEQALEALDGLGDGDALHLLLYCSPHPLFNVLTKNGYFWNETVDDDGTHEIRIRKRVP